jgi:hypothetical protein
VLQYRAGRPPDDMRQITDVIVLAQSHRGFAGQSWRFCCPGCGRRVADLYPKGVYFRCRKCCRVGYQSQRETRKTAVWPRPPGSSSDSVAQASGPKACTGEPAPARTVGGGRRGRRADGGTARAPSGLGTPRAD